MSPSNHEEADTRMILHALNASQNGMNKVDTDVVVIALGMFSRLRLTHLWISFGTGKNHRILPIHSIYNSIGPAKCSGLLFFHAFMGCDQVSFFNGKEKKIAWKTWNHLEDVSVSFVSLSNFPSNQEFEEHFPVIERYVSLMYDSSCTVSSINECRKVLFATKGRALDTIPPTHDALFSTYQTGYVSGWLLESINCCSTKSSRPVRMGLEKKRW